MTFKWEILMNVHIDSTAGYSQRQSDVQVKPEGFISRYELTCPILVILIDMDVCEVERD